MSRSTSSSSSSSSDAFDELAAMFMTPGDDAKHQMHQAPYETDVNAHDVGAENEREIGDPPWKKPLDRHDTTTTGTGTPLTELLLVGHLPVRANLWLTPYADALAREVGPVALIRLDGDGTTLEILRGRDEWRAEIAGLSIRSAIEFLARDIRAWIIRPRDIERSLSPDVIGGVDRLMLLTSADQAASEAAYQTFERVRVQIDENGIEPPTIAVTVLGSAQESATWMMRRLQSIATTNLGLSIELERVLSRIDSDVQSSVYLRFDEEEIGEAAAVLAMIEESIAIGVASRSHPADRPAAGARAAPLPSTANGHHHAEVKHSDVKEERHERVEVDARAHQRSTDYRAPGRAEASTPRIKLSPKPAQRRVQGQQEAEGRAAGVSDAHGSLASHVSGLTSVEIRSPRSDHIEIAVDAGGNVHLLCTDSHLRELSIVEAWAKEHRELLAAALAERAVRSDAAIICHLFTREPADVADLHGTEIKLHVLAPVEVEGHRGWYAAALNR